MGVLSFGMTQTAMAQDSTATAAPAQTEQVAAADEAAAPAVVEEGGLHKELKTKFIEGDAGFMSLVLSHWYLVWLSVLNVLFT